MSSCINVNITALTTQRYLATSQSALAISMQRLSSGLRINSAKDDAAGLAIGSNMTTLIRCQTVAMRNANDEISLSQTKEGALGKMNDLLQRMRELAVQSANATNSADNRTALNTEFMQMQDELIRIRKGTSFNGTPVFADIALDPALPSSTLMGSKATVTAGINDTLQVTLNGLSANVTLAPGSYTQTALAAALQSAINSNSTFVGAGSSVSASVQNGALSLVSTRQGAGSGVSLAGAAASALFGATAASSSGQPLAGTIDGFAASASGSTLIGALATTAAGLTVTALGSSTGSYTLNVNQLATSGSWLGGHLATNTTITAGVNNSLQVTLDGHSASMTLAAGSYTQAALATVVQNAINGNSTFVSAGSSVTASVQNGALSLVSARKGADSAVSLSGTAASTLIGATGTATSGLDNMATINGVAAVVNAPYNYLSGAPGTTAEGITIAISPPSAVLGNYAINISQLAEVGAWIGQPLPPSTTITAGVNDNLQVTINGVSVSKTLAPGTYAPIYLLYLVQNAINTDSTFSNAGLYVNGHVANDVLILDTGSGASASISLAGTAASSLSAGGVATTSNGKDLIATMNGSAASINGSSINGPGFAVQVPMDDSKIYGAGYGGCPLGSYEINLSRIATPGTWTGKALAPGASYTVTAGVNDSLDVTIDGLSASLTLAAGVYSGGDYLLTAVMNAINNNSTFQSAGIYVFGNLVNNALSLNTWNYGTGYGAGQSINLTGGTALNMVSGVSGASDATSTNGQNASGTINGVAATASGQTLTGATGLAVNVSAGVGSHVINVSQLPTQGSWLGSGVAGNSSSVIDEVDAALQQVNTEMVVQGATQNQLSSVIANLQTSSENLMEARSRIMDTDYAAETATLARHQIMQQAAMAMLAQANQSPKDVLALMR